MGSPEAGSVVEWLRKPGARCLKDSEREQVLAVVEAAKRIEEAEKIDARMGYPLPGDSALAACLHLDVAHALDALYTPDSAESKDAEGAKP